MVKFTKSFELLSPKCSADADNRLVLMSSMAMDYFIFHIVLNFLDHSFIFLVELWVDLIEECEPRVFTQTRLPLASNGDLLQ